MVAPNTITPPSCDYIHSHSLYFSLCITKEIVGSPSKSISIFPSVLIVWSCLSLAYFCGRMISKLNPKKDRFQNSIYFIY